MEAILVCKPLYLGTLCKIYQAKCFKNFVEKIIVNSVIGKCGKT